MSQEARPLPPWGRPLVPGSLAGSQRRVPWCVPPSMGALRSVEGFVLFVGRRRGSGRLLTQSEESSFRTRSLCRGRPAWEPGPGPRAGGGGPWEGEQALAVRGLWLPAGCGLRGSLGHRLGASGHEGRARPSGGRGSAPGAGACSTAERGSDLAGAPPRLPDSGLAG